MSKSQKKTNKMYIRASEWKAEFGGKKDEVAIQYSYLPLNCCCLSLQPFTTPVCSPEGDIFDLENVVKWLKNNKCNPVSGKPMTREDLILLNFHKNTLGDFVCPSTFKVLSRYSHVVAIRTSGEVYSYDTINQMCIIPNNYVCPVTGKPFTREDIITLQDPANMELKNTRNFSHFKKKDNEEKPVAHIVGNSLSSRVLTVLENEKTLLSQKKKIEEREQKEKEEKEEKERLPYTNKDSFIYQAGPSITAAALTSTEMEIDANKLRLQKERKREKVTQIREKGYVTLNTSLGKLNIELHADLVPRTCDNFLQLCTNGYYDGTIFHRLIKKFMIQGGDPTGKGTGGKSIWGKSFADEFYPSLTHNAAGVVSMANSGPNSNGSQFFITLGPAPHLDRVHAIFGRVVGGLDLLRQLEKVVTDKDDRPKEPITIESTTVFVDPFEGIREKKNKTGRTSVAVSTSASAPSLPSSSSSSSSPSSSPLPPPPSSSSSILPSLSLSSSSLSSADSDQSVPDLKKTKRKREFGKGSGDDEEKKDEKENSALSSSSLFSPSSSSSSSSSSFSSGSKKRKLSETQSSSSSPSPSPSPSPSLQSSMPSIGKYLQKKKKK